MGLVVLAALIATAGYTYARNRSASPAGLPPTAVLLTETASGSTNTPPWSLTILEDGSGDLSYDNGAYRLRGTDKSFPAGTFDSADIRTGLSSLKVNHPPACPISDELTLSSASISFGSYVSIVYQGHQLQSFCSTSPTEAALYKHLSAAYNTANPL